MGMKFEEYFSEVNHFSNGQLVYRGDVSAKDAAQAFSNYTGDEITENDIGEDYVRYGFAPEFMEDMHGQSCWYTGAGKKKGSKRVWTYN